MAIERPLPSTIVMVCDGVRHAAYLGDYCAIKLILFGMKPLHATDGSQGPPEAIYGRSFNEGWTYVVSDGIVRHG